MLRIFLTKVRHPNKQKETEKQAVSGKSMAERAEEHAHSLHAKGIGPGYAWSPQLLWYQWEFQGYQEFSSISDNGTYSMLTRRSQRSKLTWEKFRRIWKEYVTPPRIYVDIWIPKTV